MSKIKNKFKDLINKYGWKIAVLIFLAGGGEKNVKTGDLVR